MAAKWFTSKLGGAFNHSDSLDMLPAGATKLIEDALEGFETSSPIVDYNVSLVGVGAQGTGCSVHSHARGGWMHPVASLKLKLMESATGIANHDNWDTEYVERLVQLKTGIVKTHGRVWGRQALHPLDLAHSPSGAPLIDHSATFVPNDYAFKIVEENPNHFVPCVSIHPYRRDAVEELRKWVKRGARIVKWIPSIQGIDPSNEKCDHFYKEMARSGVILHSGGDRVLIDPPGMNLSLDNPLLLRRPLSFGVKVIVSHCATEGKSLDIEVPPHNNIDNLQLFFRMMEDPKYKGLLFGDISGVCNFTRIEYLQPLLDNTAIHSRLVYGSDYPMPAINLIVQTYLFGNKGLISEKDCDSLGDIYKVNPLMFDFVIKRTLKSKKGNKFNISIFKEHPDLQISKSYIISNLTDDESFSETTSPETSPPGTPSLSSGSSSPSLSTLSSLSVKDEGERTPYGVIQGSQAPNGLVERLKPKPSPAVMVNSPSFTITTPPSPAVRYESPLHKDPDYEAAGDGSSNEGIDEDDEGFTEEVDLAD